MCICERDASDSGARDEATSKWLITLSNTVQWQGQNWPECCGTLSSQQGQVSLTLGLQINGHACETWQSGYKGEMYREGTWVTMESPPKVTWAEHKVYRSILLVPGHFLEWLFSYFHHICARWRYPFEESGSGLCRRPCWSLIALVQTLRLDKARFPE